MKDVHRCSLALGYTIYDLIGLGWCQRQRHNYRVDCSTALLLSWTAGRWYEWLYFPLYFNLKYISPLRFFNR